MGIIEALKQEHDHYDSQSGTVSKKRAGKISEILSHIETQAKTIERLEAEKEAVSSNWQMLLKEAETLKAENKRLEECRAFYANKDTAWECIRIIPQDREHIDGYNYGGKLARETAKKIEAIRKKE